MVYNFFYNIIPYMKYANSHKLLEAMLCSLPWGISEPEVTKITTEHANKYRIYQKNVETTSATGRPDPALQLSAASTHSYHNLSCL